MRISAFGVKTTSHDAAAVTESHKELVPPYHRL